MHDRVTPSTLSPKPIAYDKPIDPSEMPRISTCSDTIMDDTIVLTKDDNYPWLDLEDIKGMQIIIQAISFIVCAIVTIKILYQIFKRC